MSVKFESDDVIDSLSDSYVYDGRRNEQEE